MLRRAMLALVALVACTPAWGQSRPSFDCAKATGEIETSICRHADLGDADRTMVASYTKLLATLEGAARTHLQADQARWLWTNVRLCGASIRIFYAAEAVDQETHECLKQRLERRLTRLSDMPTGSDYPFVSEETFIEAGKVAHVNFRFYSIYPQFRASDVDNTALNRGFETAAKATVSENKPTRDDVSVLRPGMLLTAADDLSLLYPAPGLVTVLIFHTSYLGGAHGMSATSAALVEIASGRRLTLDDVLSRPAGWPALAKRLTLADLRRQFVERPRSEDALTEENIGKMLAESSRWVFGRDGVEITFNPYEIGPYAVGPYTVTLTYEQLRPVIRLDGRLAAKLR